jgi:PAS domain S-box-containing protein
MIKDPAAGKHPFLAGGGEMGEFMRNRDWSKTPVGDPSTWPQSLRTTISIILNSRFPMFLFWGPHHVCFYNDAYRPSLGKEGKHPEILGGKGMECWPEIWPTIKPLIDQVLAGEGATWSENQLIPIYRNGKLEDVYWTFSYSPVHDETGSPAGVFVTCVETTTAVLNEKEKQKLIAIIEGSDQFIGLTGADMSIQYGNPAALQMLGWDSYAGRKMQDCIYPPDMDFAANLLPQVLEGSAGISEIRFWNERTGNPFWLQWNGLTMKDTVNKNITGLAIISPDITEKRRTQKALEVSESNLRLMIMQAPVAIGILRTSDHIVEIANTKALEIWGRTEAQSVGRPIMEVVPELLGQGIKQIIDEVYRTGIRFSADEFPIRFERNGRTETAYINFSFEPLYNSDGRINGIMAIGIEVTKQALSHKKTEASEKEFRQLTESLPGLVWTTDGEGKQTFVTSQWKEFTGVDPSDRESFTAMTHPDDLDRVLNTWAASMETGLPYKVELRLKSKSGEYQWFYANANPVKDAAGIIEKWVGAFTNINDQKVAENNLRIALQRIEESENRFKKIADNAPVLIRLTNTERLTTYFNKAWLDFTGRTLEQELNNGWKEGLHPVDAQRFIDTYNRSFDLREEFYIEYRLRRHDGEYRWIFHHGAPRFTADGTFEGYIGACMDIHEQVMHKDYLESSEERLNIVIEASELGTWELDLKTRVPVYSDRYMQILGYDHKIKMTHEELLTHLHPDDLPTRDAAMRKAIETGSLDYQSRLIWRDGSIHWVEAKGKVFYDKNNSPVKMIGTLRDITEEKRYNQELQEREKKFQTLADFMPQFVWTGDPKGKLTYFNKAMFDFSGLSVQQITGEGWIQIVHPDERAANLQAWKESVDRGTDFLYEHRFRRYDGQYRWQLSRAIPQKDENGHVQMWIGTSTDIEDIKEQEQLKDYFISMASHELKTPVTSIKGYVQIMQSMYADAGDAFLLNSLTVVDRQIITLTKLITELLDISKIKSGGLDFNTEDFEVNELVKECVSEIRHINPSHNIEISTTGKVVVHADRHRIAQVLINFLTNAVKYSPESKIIRVKIARDAGHVFVSVSDQGIGISKKDQERIFERFYRVEGKNEKTFPGFGIGLFIASEIIKKHRGTITVDSTPGKGSVFTFTLPIKQQI